MDLGITRRTARNPGSATYNYKTALCNNWVKTGKCSYNKICMYAHGNHEIMEAGEYDLKKKSRRKRRIPINPTSTINPNPNPTSTINPNPNPTSTINPINPTSTINPINPTSTINPTSPLNPRAKIFEMKTKIESNYGSKIETITTIVINDNDIYDSYWSTIHNLILNEYEAGKIRLANNQQTPPATPPRSPVFGPSSSRSAGPSSSRSAGPSKPVIQPVYYHRYPPGYPRYIPQMYNQQVQFINR
jgi:hypothetical protein